MTASRPINAHPSLRVGIACAVMAHVIWGFFPLYWRLFPTLPATVLTAHRVVWSCLILLTLCVVVRGLRRNFWSTHARRTIAIHAAAAVMIAINWMAFLYAVGSEQVLQASLGYYINPLVNVLLGVAFLKERLRSPQLIAVGLAAIGVSVMAVSGTGFPWISLAMALSFGFYGLLKKKATLGPFEGLAMETAVLFPVAVIYLLFQSQSDAPEISATTWMLLWLGGALTILPLALFATAAKRVSLSTIGILQYIGPTLQWIVGAIVLSEPVGRSQFVGFVFVWAGVLMFLAGDKTFRWYRRRSADAFKPLT